MRTHIRFVAISSALTSLLLVGCKKDTDQDVSGTQTTIPRSDQTLASRRPAENVAPEPDHTQRAEHHASAARDEYVRAGRERVAKIDARIQELEAKGDAKAKQAAAELRVRRDELAADLDRAADRADAEWDAFKADVDKRFDALEKDLDDAF